MAATKEAALARPMAATTEAALAAETTGPWENPPPVNVHTLKGSVSQYLYTQKIWRSQPRHRLWAGFGCTWNTLGHVGTGELIIAAARALSIVTRNVQRALSVSQLYITRTPGRGTCRFVRGSSERQVADSPMMPYGVTACPRWLHHDAPHSAPHSER